MSALNTAVKHYRFVRLSPLLFCVDFAKKKEIENLLTNECKPERVCQRHFKTGFEMIKRYVQWLGGGATAFRLLFPT